MVDSRKGLRALVLVETTKIVVVHVGWTYSRAARGHALICVGYHYSALSFWQILALCPLLLQAYRPLLLVSTEDHVQIFIVADHLQCIDTCGELDRLQPSINFWQFERFPLHL